MLLLMAACTVLVSLGMIEVVTHFLSVLAIIISSIVLIEGYGDTAALTRKLTRCC